ncbi:MAG TPA: SBBP repeat-containing protein [Anaerolineales bacterium]|nr:SBBP repeat-containing protein [Anaerolineales bacterium]
MRHGSRIQQALLTGLFALCLLLPWGGPVAAQPAPEDATLTWNTFLGGSMYDEGAQSIAVDGDGNTYVVGSSQAAWSCDPTPCTVRAFTGGAATYSNGFVAKLDANGNLLWNTFQGSYPGYNETNGVAVDNSGGLYITGWSTQYIAGNWTGAGSGEFVAKLNASDGALQWVQYVDYSIGTGVVADNNGHLYAVGQTFSAWGCHPVSCTTVPFTGGGGYLYDGYVAEFDASTGALLWNAFLGGTGDDFASSVTLDGNANVYVAGAGESSWGAPIRAYNPGVSSHPTDVFAAKFSGGGTLLWNTFLGGDGTEGSSIIYDNYRGIAVDGDGNAYVSGKSSAAWSCAPVACTVRAYTQYGTNESTDAFVAKLTTDGALVWNTFLGTIMDDLGNSIAADSLGNTYVAGKSGDTWGNPVRPFVNYDDAFAAKLDTNGALLWNTFLGRGDFGNGLARDAAGNIYVAGSGNTWTWGNPIRPLSSDLHDLFVAKLPEPPATLTKTVKSTALQDGWVLESGEKTNTGGTKSNTQTALLLGDDKSRKQYRSILSFNTGAALPDAAVITSIKLKVRKQGIVGGGNPVTAFQGFMLDVKKGTLGASALELNDFQVTASSAYKTFGPFKPAPDASGWYTITLPATAASYINKLSASSGLTQIRLRFQQDDNNNAAANYLGLYSGNAPDASRPQLIVQYYLP